MNIAYHIVGVVAALWVGFSGYSLFAQKKFVADPLVEYGVPKSWWNWLALAKSAGALGLFVGFFVPALGIAAAAGLILYFLGAAATTLRAHSYNTTVYPVLYLVPVVATLALQMTR
ncbi:DoxX family protein [Nocardia sp. NEAU-G5]|uniref:DoxX family protein n=1 Tax=Nocardia albiluteola TaxID=2842303 RepID=A0ABS6B516_9NOCA|nr:DoxX family protein [Nocardia albiluteola]MBU3064318.1 DoxX family protein [Nocardia albiluteola]